MNHLAIESASAPHGQATAVGVFDPSIVDAALVCLLECEKTKPLGVPSRILLCEQQFVLGVGVAWDREGHDTIRNAVAFHGANRLANYTETKRRIEEWIDAGK